MAKPVTKINKSEWVRSQPPTLSAKEIIEKAAKQGFTLSAAQVYVIRHAAKKGRTSVRGRPHLNAAPAVEITSVVSAPVSDESRRQFMQLALRIGTDEAHRLMQLLRTPAI